MARRTIVKDVLWLLVGMAAAVALARFLRGLGATTALTDSTPWGLWIGFDVMAGVALAAGGFVIAGAYYIFRIEKFKPFVRPAVLTAFLGYVAVVVGLMFDLGLPWNIWHPMIYWQYHSVLFEVAMCVMAYLTVLGLEFMPVALEHKIFRYKPLQLIYKTLKSLTIPLVILGIMLSTLHQSSLGSLFIIMPHRVHPLWYSPGIVLPASFFISAIALGFMMVMLEHFASSWVYSHKPRIDLLGRLGAYAAVALVLYLVIRVWDLVSRGVLPGAIDGSWQSMLFIFEIAISALVPAALMASSKMRKSPGALFAACFMVVSGMVLYRLDTAFITIKKWPGMEYFPTMVEFMVSIGIVSAMVLVFMYFVENLDVFPESMTEGEKRELETADQVLAASEQAPRGVVPGTVQILMKRWFLNADPFQKPAFSASTGTWFGDPLQAGVRKYSMLAIIAIALTAAVLPTEAIFGYKPDQTPVLPARMDQETKGDVMWIDGNREAESVEFDHAQHEELTGGKQGCVECHHMSDPEDFATPCASCHSDMYLETSIFDHDVHREEYGGNEGCVECHPVDKAPENARSCASCHQDMWPKAAEGERVDHQALSYQEAMHENCITCHEKEASEFDRPDLGECAACHH